MGTQIVQSNSFENDLSQSLHRRVIKCLMYKGHPKSFRPRNVRQQYFPQLYISETLHPLRTPMSQLQI